MRRYLPHTIYQNLVEFLKYRSLDLVSGASYIDTKKKSKKIEGYLEQDDFIKDIQYYGYIMLEAKDNPQKDRRFLKSVHPLNRKKPVKTYILLLDQNSVHTQSSQNFVKLLNKIPGFDEKDKNHNIDVIIIHRHDLSIHLLKKIDASIKLGTETDGFIHLHHYKYLYFTSERPKHKLVAPQRILSKEEERKVLDELYTDKKNLPKIRKVEPIAVWLGAEIGDIVEARMPSENTGIETKYLVVRP